MEEVNVWRMANASVTIDTRGLTVPNVLLNTLVKTVTSHVETVTMVTAMTLEFVSAILALQVLLATYALPATLASIAL
jgi:hypothetical protein